MKPFFTPCRPLCVFFLLLISLFGVAQPVVRYERFLGGLADPVEVVNAGDGSGRLFIVEQGGTIKVWKSGTAVEATPFLTIPPVILFTGGEQGLLSLAFHPNYESNGFFYVYYTRSDWAIVVARYQVSAGNPDVADPTGTELAVIPHSSFQNHNGGHLQFRVEGLINYLYFATGDGGSGNDPSNNAQNNASRLGKFLRIDVDNPPLPSLPEIWGKGLRNPFRWSFDRLTGDVWIGDVGQGLKEEVDFWPAAGGSGANYGWRCFEGTEQNLSVPLCDPPDDIPPVFEYDNPNGPGNPPSAVTGGYVYRGSIYDDLYGYYITADFYSGQVWLIRPNFTWITQTLRNGVAGFGEDEDGELYCVSLFSDSVYKIKTNFSLPVGLLSFTGRHYTGYNELRWTTSFEQDVQSFIVEYSTDGISYLQAGEIAATNNPSGYSYSFIHSTSETRKLFYRLRMKDLDGSSKQSPVITLGGNSGGVIKIFPTMIRNAQLEMTTSMPVSMISLVSTDGREVFKKALNDKQGYFSITLPQLSRGYYIVCVRGNGVFKTEKVLIE